MKLFSGLAISVGLCLIFISGGASAAVVAPPTFLSTPTIASGPAVVGVPIVFCVAAADPQSLPFTINYNYGDGGTDSLGKHVYVTAGVYPVTVTISNGVFSNTATLTVNIGETTNLWIKKQSIKVGAAGKQSWQAQYIYNADRTQANIFNPAAESFVASLGNIPAIQIPGAGTQKFAGSKPKFTFKSAKGVVPSVSVAIDESNQTITIKGTSETFADKVPGIFRNTVQLGANGFFLDQAFDAKGKFTANSGYRSIAFVVSAAKIMSGKPGKDSATFALLLGDPAYVFPGASGAKTVHVRVTNVLRQIVLDKDLTAIVTAKGTKLKSGKDASIPPGKFSYDSKSGKMSFGLSKATLAGLLTTSEEHVRVDVNLGDQTYSTGVTLFAAKAGAYSTKMPKTFAAFIPGKTLDTLAPKVLSTIPANLAGDASSIVSATFSEPMNPATLTTATFTLQQGTTLVPGTVAYADNTATFTPNSPLAAGASFVATITTGATDVAGNPLVCNYVWTFAKAAAPSVSSTNPANGATGVVLNQLINATFSKAMDPATIGASTFTIATSSGAALAGTVTYDSINRIATFKPAAIAPLTSYTATVTTGAKDLSGNALVGNAPSGYVWTFTSGAAADTTPPTVSATDPLDNDTGVALNKKISASFSEAIDAATVSTSFTLFQGATPISGAVTYSGLTATFTPSSDLAPSAIYTATVTTGAKDLAGNALAANFVWHFTTGTTADITPPKVISTIPVDAATAVAFNSKVSATFNETMDPLTITTSTFTVMQGATPVVGTVIYAGTGSTATFTPSASLTPNTVYTATVTTGAKDLAGNALAADFVWHFTTGPSPDTTPPLVMSTIPIDTATGVAINSKMSATFNEAMDALTINTSTFTLMQGAAPVSGTVNYAVTGSTATFTPSANLAPNTLFTATVTTGAKDLAGNALTANFVWHFTTGAVPDTTPPTVTSTNPIDQATGVAINHTVNATFSEAMDPATINTANFTLAGPGPGPNPITGTLAYDAQNKTATFTPGSDLSPNTQFTATISTGVKDLAGNALAVNKVWTFTTGTQRVLVAVPLGAAAPFGSLGGGAGLTNQGLFSVVNGDIGTTGASTTVTGLHDNTGDIYTETPLNVGQVNGRIYTAPPTPGGAGVGGNATTMAIATQSASDANTAYIKLSPASLPGGTDPGAGQLGGLTLPPGIYQSAGGSFLITGSDLTLDAQGDSNAVWVFQMASSLTVGGPAAPRTVNLINGAQAKNVFWQVGSSATINAAGGGTMVGTIIASAGVSFSTAGNVQIVTLNGRALGLNASSTLVNTVINVPAP